MALHARTFRGFFFSSSFFMSPFRRLCVSAVAAGGVSGAFEVPGGERRRLQYPMYTERIQLRELSRPLTCAPEGSVPFSWEERVSGRMTCRLVPLPPVRGSIVKSTP